MATVGGFLGGGVEIVPAGKHQIYLQWQTADRQNISGVTFTIGTQTIPADEYGRAVALVDSGSAVTITCSHSGTYSGDGPQTINTPSAEQTFVYFYGAKNSALDAYPVGSIYMSAVATDPSTLLGGGTWKRIAQGRTLIGEGTSDKAFSAGTTGGESSHTLSTSEMPNHRHSVTPEGDVGLSLDSGTAIMVSDISTSNSSPANRASGTGIISSGNVLKETVYKAASIFFGAFHSGWTVGDNSIKHYAVEMNITPTGTATFTGSSSSSTYQGGGASHNNLPPYLVCYIWQRTA